MKLFKSDSSRGFTLIEILIVSSLTIFLTLNLLSNFIRSRLNISEVARIVVSDIRTAQANTLSSKQFKDPITGLITYRCGYGLHKLDSSESAAQNPPIPVNSAYFIFVGRVAQSSGCPAANNAYQPSQDSLVVFTRVLDARLELLSPTTGNEARFDDIYFKVPDGQIFINNQHDPDQTNPARKNKAQIIIRKIGAVCPSSNCVYICVYAKGKIETRNTVCDPI